VTHASHATLCTSHLTHHTSYLTPHTSHLTPHTSHLTPHTSHLTPHPSPLTPSPLTPHPSPQELVAERDALKAGAGVEKSVLEQQQRRINELEETGHPEFATENP
jgi:hypothetical protein